MPWSSNGNDGKGGGPWQPRNNSPWGQGGGGGSGGNGPPNFDEMLRQGQERLRRLLPGQGGDSPGALGILAIILLGVLVWLVTGLYTIKPNEIGIERVFGKYSGLAKPGLNYNWPYPIGRVDKLLVGVRSVEIGMRAEQPRSTSRRSPVPQESLMLTGDENIVDIDFTVLWRINEALPQDYVFNLKNPDATVKAVAEASMREVIGKSNVLDVLTGARLKIEQQVQEMMQKTLNDYGAGVIIQQVQMQKVDPPQQVINNFRDVQAARADQERLQNEAQAHANKVVPEARGKSARIVQEAEAEKEKMVADAKGEAARFIKLYEEYRKAPAVTRERLYLESIERIYSGMDKVLLDAPQKGGAGVVPVLPLNELIRRPAQQGTR